LAAGPGGVSFFGWVVDLLVCFGGFLGVDFLAGDGKLDGLPLRGSEKILDGVCPFLENSTV
jgi:hypothetical protein